MKEKFVIRGVAFNTESIISNIIGNLVGGAMTAIIVGLALAHYERHVDNLASNDKELVQQTSLWSHYQKKAQKFCVDWKTDRKMAIEGALPQSAFISVPMVQPPLGVDKVVPERDIEAISSSVDLMHKSYLDFSVGGIQYVVFRHQSSDATAEMLAAQMKPKYDASVQDLLKAIDGYCAATRAAPEVSR